MTMITIRALAIPCGVPRAIGDIVECVDDSAFDDFLAGNPRIDVFAFDHDADVVLASTRGGTAAFYADARGLYFEAECELGWGNSEIASMTVSSRAPAECSVHFTRRDFVRAERKGFACQVVRTAAIDHVALVRHGTAAYGDRTAAWRVDPASGFEDSAPWSIRQMDAAFVAARSAWRAKTQRSTAASAAAMAHADRVMAQLGRGAPVALRAMTRELRALALADTVKLPTRVRR